VQPPAALARYQRALDDHLRSLVAQTVTLDLSRMLAYHLGWQDISGKPATHTGKRLRPTLCLLACEGAAGDPARALPAAAAVELVHNFSLVHDDVQDRDEKRHGRDTVWAVWGEAQAINAGDALLALAHLALAEMPDAEAAAAASRILNQRTLEMVEGQVMDIEFEKRVDIGLDAYLEMISRKTGALFDAALSLGAVAAAAPPETTAALGRCGRRLGLAFQVRDDMLGIWGAESRTGKPVGADIRRRKKSLPIVYALDRAESDERDRLAAVYSASDVVSENDMTFVMRVLDALGAQGYCQEQAAIHRAAAMAELEASALAPAFAAEIREVADFLLERDF